MREQLAIRAKQQDLYTFLNSLNPQEYRELSFFWQSPVTFWEGAQ